MVAFNQSSQRGSFLALATIAALIVSSSSSVAMGAPSDQLCCPSSIKERKDCGYGGITEAQCRQKNCCWDSSISDSKVPQCFNQKERANTCPTDKTMRIDCGFGGIGKEECSKRNCCWDDSTSDRFPMCFKYQSTCTA